MVWSSALPLGQKKTWLGHGHRRGDHKKYGYAFIIEGGDDWCVCAFCWLVECWLNGTLSKQKLQLAFGAVSFSILSAASKRASKYFRP